MFDWDHAEEVLYAISKDHLTRFLGQQGRDDIYGLGFFCDLIEGVMLVANTRACHDSSFQESKNWSEKPNEALFRWDIGNWEYPAGLFPSDSEEQAEFDRVWKEVGVPVAYSDEDERTQRLLEALCGKVFKRLAEAGVLTPARGLEGLVVLGPDDEDKAILTKKKRLDPILKRRS
jgi:hypothetical protein